MLYLWFLGHCKTRWRLLPFVSTAGFCRVDLTWTCVVFSSFIFICSCILGLCDWLWTVSTVVWIGFLPMMQFIFACNMLMHSHALFFSFLLYWACVLVCFCLFSIVFLLWHPKSLFLLRIWSHVVVFLLFLFPLEIGFAIQNPKRILRKTFVTGRFIRNARLFYLIFQTHHYPMHLVLEVGSLSTRNPLDVPACLYKSSSPTYTLSIPLFLSLLWYSEEHVL